MTLNVGDHFRVKTTGLSPHGSVVETLRGKDGTLIAKYLAGLFYRVTPVNAALVRRMFGAGAIEKAHGQSAGDGAISLNAGGARIGGLLRVGPRAQSK